MRTCAIIPARGGSKAVPRKNVLDFCGHPLIAWTIAAARRSPVIETVYVSTDSDEIASVSEKYGAQTIWRPAELAADSSSSESALLHACDSLKQQLGQEPDTVFFLQATSPLRCAGELDRAYEKFTANNLDSLFCAAEPEDQLVWIRRQSGDLESVNYDYQNRKPRQDSSGHDTLLIETGSFYIFKTQVLRATGNRLGGKFDVFEVPHWQCFEIDSFEGLELCAHLMRAYKLDQISPQLATR